MYAWGVGYGCGVGGSPTACSSLYGCLGLRLQLGGRLGRGVDLQFCLQMPWLKGAVSMPVMSGGSHLQLSLQENSCRSARRAEQYVPMRHEQRGEDVRL